MRNRCTKDPPNRLLKKYSILYQWSFAVYRWLCQMVDPLRVAAALLAWPKYFSDWRTYSRLFGAERIHLIDTSPQLHDRTTTTQIDYHYYFANGWAMRRILIQRPRRHVDIGSQPIFANLLAATLPVIFVDYRPVKEILPGMNSVGASMLELPFADKSIGSISCLHVIEHIGLGRYGDPLDPEGTRKSFLELLRILAPGGNLYLALPIGRPRLCFNAHRIHTAEKICQYCEGLELKEFSGVHDHGTFVERVNLSEFRGSEYACGMFWFKRSISL